MRKYQVIRGNVYIFPAQRIRVVRGMCQGDEGYLVGWTRDKNNQIRCMLMLDEWGKDDFPMEIVRPIHKTTGRSSGEGAA